MEGKSKYNSNERKSTINIPCSECFSSAQEITYTRFLDLDPEKDFLIMYGEGNWKSTDGCCAPVLCETGKLIE